MKVVVTGGSGRAGRYIIDDLLKQGHEVVNADRTPPPGSPVRGVTNPVFKQTDTTDFGQVVAALKGADAVIHMSAIPNPIMAAEHEVFRVNMLSDWHVLEAAEIHGIPKVVKASSINAVGAVFSKAAVPPLYFPLDEEHPTRVEDAYSQSKWLGEQMSIGFCRRRRVQIASMRFHGLWDRERQSEHRRSGNKTDVAGRPAMQFWGWVDVAEAARACVLALDTDWTGHEAFFINAPDTTLDVPTMDAIEAVYPGVEIRSPLTGFASPISTEKARRLLGWQPKVTWRNA